MSVGDLTPPERHFSYYIKDILSNLDWSNLDEVIDAFERRIQEWYLEPANILLEEKDKAGFIITSIGCVIIDALSQFREGADAHNPKHFKKFTEMHFPEFSKSLPKVIDSDIIVGSTHDVDTVSEAFYSGFRCGIVHSGTILAFGGVPTVSDDELYEILFDPEGVDSYCYDKETGEKYPFVRINPIRLIEEIRSAFNQYLSELRKPDPNERLRRNFAKKIEYDFGEYGTRLKNSL